MTAFILYRQHHQASVVAQHPGLANPDISKIIGEQWQGLPLDEKNKWKALAEEEKLRHQQQYPTYRYQPKRNGRRNSVSEVPGSAGEKPKCTKCGGRTILTPSTPFAPLSSGSVPATPGLNVLTPVARTLPVFRELSIQSPAGQYVGQHHSISMSPPQSSLFSDRDDAPLSPGSKRRRFNDARRTDRSMPPRYSIAQSGAPLGPGTPFPFGPVPPQQPYGMMHTRRDSLPGLACVVSPGPMGPPPRPGMGYQAHRLSRGHIPTEGHLNPLTLPPLKTGHGEVTETPPTTTKSIKTAEEHILDMDFRYKVQVLSQVAPPATRANGHRGPLIAVEGDSPEAARELAVWLKDTLAKDDDLMPTLLDGPDPSPIGSKQQMMGQYHRLAAEWLAKSDTILETMTVPVETPDTTDAAMTDATQETQTLRSQRKIDEDYNVAEHGETISNPDSKASEMSQSNLDEKMDLDREQKRASMVSTASMKSSTAGSRKPEPIAIIANYSLHASNRFACTIPIGSPDPYSPNDHWQWAATQWRGIIGPDLTIYVCDNSVEESGKPAVEIEPTERKADYALFVVRKSSGFQEGENEGVNLQVSQTVLRRVGFEVSEWVRAFKTKKSR